MVSRSPNRYDVPQTQARQIGNVVPLADGALWQNIAQATGQVASAARARLEQQNAQLRASSVARARSMASSRVNQFMQEMQRNPDPSTYNDAWTEFNESLTEDLQAFIGDDMQTWNAFAPSFEAIRGGAQQQLQNLTFARNDDRIRSGANQALHDIVVGAGGGDPTVDRNEIRRIGMDLFETGVIDETQMGELVRSTLRDYNISHNLAAIRTDAPTWIDSHSTVTPSGNAPRGVRNNNPLNLRRSSAAWQGRAGTQTDAAFEQFATPQHGIRAALLNLQRYADRGIATIGEALSTWAPHGDGDNDPNAYAARVESLSGLSADTPFNPHDPDQMRLLIPAMIIVENGMQPYTHDVYQEAFEMAGLPTDGDFAARTDRLEFVTQGVDGLSLDDQARLFAEADREASRQLATAQQEVNDRVENELAALGAGIVLSEPTPDADILAAYRNDIPRGEAIIEGLETARAAADDIAGLHDMTDAEIGQTLRVEAQALTAGGDDMQERLAHMGAMTEAANRILKQRQDDPAGYVASQDPRIEAAFQLALGEQGTPANLRTAIELSLSAQDFFDDPTDRRPLPDAMLSSVMDTYHRTEDVGERVRLIQSITTGLQDDAAASLVLDQMEAGGLDPAWRYILDADVSDSRRSDLANLLLDPEAMNRWEQRYPETTARNEALTQALTAYDETRGFVYDGRIAVLGNVGGAGTVQQTDREIAERLAIALATRTGDPEDPSAAMDTAVEMLFGSQKPIDDSLGFAFVPSGNAELVTAGMEAVRADLQSIVPLEEFGAMLGDAGIPEDVARLAWRGMADDALWVNQAGGYALAMPVSNQDSVYGRLLVDSNNEIRVWTAEELMAASPQAAEARLDATLSQLESSVPPDTAVGQ